MSVLVLVMVVILVLGYGYIKKQRSKLQASRERKIKIAQGIFDDVPAQAAGKCKEKRKRKLKWFNYRNVETKPEPSPKELTTKIPILVEEMLQARHAYQAAYDAVIQGERDYTALNEGNHGVVSGGIYVVVGEKLALPARLDRANLDAWTAQMIARYLNTRQVERRYGQQRLELVIAYQAFKKAFDVLSSELYGLKKKYNLDELSQAAQRVYEIANLALTECYVTPHLAFPTVLKPKNLALPGSPDSKTELLLSETLDSLKDMLAALVTANASYAVAQREFAKAEQVAPEPNEPQKPVEDEVQVFLGACLSWAREQATQEQIVQSTLSAVEAALADLRAKITTVSELYRKLDALPEWKTVEKRSEEAVSLWKAVERSEETVSPLNKISTGWIGPSESVLIAEVIQQQEIESQHQAILTDEQASQKEVVKSIVFLVNQWVNHAQTLVNDWSKKTPRPTVSGQTEEATIAALRAAMRKLGFALAQKNAVSVKINEFHSDQANPANRTGPVQPTLAAPNVESFIQSHRKWCNVKASDEVARKNRAQQGTVLQQQSNERRNQVYAAARDIVGLITSLKKDANLPAWSAELDVVARAAWLMAAERYQRYMGCNLHRAELPSSRGHGGRFIS